MKNYLSFGGGVNSVAMHLLLLEQGVQFETIFVDHETDWPETYEYFKMFQGWLITRGLPRITVLKPDVQGYSSIYDYFWHYEMVPSFMLRICTDRFKVRVLTNHVSKPCFMMLGIDAGESKRAKLNTNKGIENRFPLIEAEIDRLGCEEIIKAHGLPLPMKSGCYICPFQKRSQWKELRMKHPDLFCDAEKLEKRNMEYRERQGKKPLYLNQSPKAPLSQVVQENQTFLFEEMEYPPCQCGL